MDAVVPPSTSIVQVEPGLGFQALPGEQWVAVSLEHSNMYNNNADAKNEAGSISHDSLPDL